MKFPRYIPFVFVAILSVQMAAFPVAATAAEPSPIAAADKELTQEEKFVKAKDGLVKALDLSLQKANTITSNLDKLSFEEDSTEYKMRAGFLQSFSGHSAYYKKQLDAAKELNTLDDVQALAKEVKTYRDEVYSQSAEETVAFVLVFYTDDVINVANERFQKISRDIEKLSKLDLIGDGAFSEELMDARALLDSAAELQSLAKVGVLGGESGTSTAAVKLSGDTDDRTPKLLLEEGLTSVKSAYAIFVNISNSIKSTLGI